MKNTKTTWEDSRERYSLLLEGLNELIRNTTKLAQSYEETNMEFAHVLYENGLTEIMERANRLKEYERNFEFMYYALKGQVVGLKHLRETINLILIKDPVNCPHN